MNEETGPKIKVKEVAPGFVSVHVHEPDGSHWSSGTLVQSDRLYGPFFPEEEERLYVNHGVLTVVPVDNEDPVTDVRIRESITLPPGYGFYMLARTSVAYTCYYGRVSDTEEDEEGEPAEEPRDEGKPEGDEPEEPRDEGKTPPARGVLAIPPRPAPPRAAYSVPGPGHSGIPGQTRRPRFPRTSLDSHSSTGASNDEPRALDMPRPLRFASLEVGRTGTSIQEEDNLPRRPLLPGGTSTPDGTDVPPGDEHV